LGIQITNSGGEVIITNDGATILKQMEVNHPAAKMVRALNFQSEIRKDLSANIKTKNLIMLCSWLIWPTRKTLKPATVPPLSQS
jgi:T-complex protein 1 subunit delta